MKTPRPGFATAYLVAVLLCAIALTAVVLARRTIDKSMTDAQVAASALTIHIVSPTANAAVEGAADVLRRSESVRSAIPIDSERAAQLLNSYGGNEIDPDSLPSVNLVEVRLRPTVFRNAATLELGALLDSAGYAAEIYDAGPATHGANRAVLITMFGAATVLSTLVVALFLSSRSQALAQPELAALHADLGGTRSAALAAYGREGAERGFLAGLAADAVCIVCGVAAVLVSAPNMEVQSLFSQLDPWEIVILLAAPLVAAGVSGAGARAGAARVFTSAERLA